jgi:hypothetical protein
MSDERKRGDGQHLVGYGRPPAEHRFQKGVSGNPKGRPRRARPEPEPPATTFDEAVLAEARRKIPLREEGRASEISTLRAALRALAVSGLQGDIGALREFLRLAAGAQERTEKLQSEAFIATLDLKAAWAERKKADPTAEYDDPLTHPDDLQVDLATGQVRVNGPQDDGERAKWASAQQRRADDLDDIAYHRKQLRRRNYPPEWREIDEREIAFFEQRIRFCDAMYPAEEIRRAPGFDLRAWRMKHLQPFIERGERRKKERAQRRKEAR